MDGTSTDGRDFLFALRHIFVSSFCFLYIFEQEGKRNVWFIKENNFVFKETTTTVYLCALWMVIRCRSAYLKGNKIPQLCFISKVDETHFKFAAIYFFDRHSRRCFKGQAQVELEFFFYLLFVLLKNDGADFTFHPSRRTGSGGGLSASGGWKVDL